MNIKKLLTLSVILLSSVAAKPAVHHDAPMKIILKARPHATRLATDYDLNWTVPENYLNWNFRLVNTNTSVEYYFSTDGVNSIGVLGYIPAGHYLVEFSSSYTSNHVFEYNSCWGAYLLGFSNYPAGYYLDFTDTCNELSASLEY